MVNLMVKFTQKQLDDAYQVSHALFVEFVEKQKRTDIQGIGVGEKMKTVKFLFWKHEVPTGELAIIFSVREKLPPEAVNKMLLIPTYINDYKTDVQETGEIKLLTLNSRIRPVQSGYSWGNPKITAGSPGTQVKYNGKTYVDTNWHVGLYKTGVIGDPIIQPGTYDGGHVETDVVGHVRISNEDPSQGHGVYTDYSLVEMDVEKFDPVLSQSGAVPGIFKFAASGDKLFWEGRSSGFKRGNVSAQHQDVQVGDPDGKVWYFYDTDYFYPAPIGGDSGSAIWADPGVELKGRTVNCIGKLFAGSETMGVMIPARSIQKIYPGIQVDSSPQNGGGQSPATNIKSVELFILSGNGEYISAGKNTVPDANDGKYRWLSTPRNLGSRSCYAVVETTDGKLFKGEVRGYIVKNEDTPPPPPPPPETEYVAVVEDPAEGQELTANQEKTFVVRVDKK